jgi:probable F420-dependent oxidoreductase
VAAGVTERIRLGTAVLNMPFVAPAVLGKALASLDVLSGGRLVAGLGLGWLPEEFAAAGVPYEGRGARGEEYLAALRALWGPDPVVFEGEHYRVPPSSVLPKPVQQPGPPVLLGGTAPKALERAGRLADGWISSSRAGFEAIAEAVRTVRGAAERAGRDPAALRMVVRAATGVDRPRTRPLTGSVDEVRDDLDTLAGYGVDETFIDLNFDDRIGNPDADADTSARTAMDLLEALAP